MCARRLGDAAAQKDMQARMIEASSVAATLNFNVPNHVRSRTSRKARQHRDKHDRDQDFFRHACLGTDHLG